MCLNFISVKKKIGKLEKVIMLDKQLEDEKICFSVKESIYLTGTWLKDCLISFSSICRGNKFGRSCNVAG